MYHVFTSSGTLIMRFRVKQYPISAYRRRRSPTSTSRMKTVNALSTCGALIVAGINGAHAFITPSLPATAAATRQTTSTRALCMSATEGSATRGEALRVMGTALLGVVAGVSLGPSTSTAASTADANRKLSSYDLPPITDAPDGFNTLLESYGTKDQTRDTSILGSSDREPILVTWNYPKGWLVQTPSMDTNKEAGTVSTGDYGRGDSAALFVAPKSIAGGSNISDKGTIEGIIRKALSQKGENQYQSFKLKSVKEGTTDFKGNKYFLADFNYELLTGAGFTVERKGVASVTQAGNSVQAVVAATTANRSKKMKPGLDEIVKSFRVYQGNFSK